MTLLNLTPHAVHFRYSAEVDPHLTLHPVASPARVVVTREQQDVLSIHGISVPVNRAVFGEVENLPPPEDGTAYVVSRVVAEAARGRDDLYIVDDTVRDAEGRIVGARALARV